MKLTFLAGWLCLGAASGRADVWCTGYYPGYEQSALPPSAIDFGALTHVIHFALLPNADGTLNSADNGITATRSSAIISAAHAAGKKVLICVGGAGTSFQSATSGTNLSAFITNIVNFMWTRGYDGVDLDWEPLNASDTQQFTNLVFGLRAALNAHSPRPLLTAAIASPPTPPALIAQLQGQFDQINLMTYDLSGPYAGWVTWFNAPIYDGGYRFASTGALVPSADGMVSHLTTNGVAAGKLGIGIAFYGYKWSGGAGTTTGGVTQPRQSWTNAPTTSTLSYNTIMNSYYQSNRYFWDAGGQAAYLSFDDAGSTNDYFISYDDQRTCQSKVSYARNRGLGGVMIWELAQDHRTGQSDPLLQAIKQALATPGPLAIQRSGTNIHLSFQSAPLGSYRVQWSGDLNAGVWNSLLVTNMTGTGGVMVVTDPGGSGQARRFYRIKTPP